VKFIAKPSVKPQTAAAQMKMAIKCYAAVAEDTFFFDAATAALVVGVTSIAEMPG